MLFEDKCHLAAKVAFLDLSCCNQRIALDLSMAKSNATAAKFLKHLVEPLVQSALQLEV